MKDLQTPWEWARDGKLLSIGCQLQTHPIFMILTLKCRYKSKREGLLIQESTYDFKKCCGVSFSRIIAGESCLRSMCSSGSV